MYEERLLERIGNLERYEGTRRSTDLSRAISSLINHLQRMLNTRKGSVLIDEDYGIPDMTNFPGENFNEAGIGMSNIIKEFIQKYEPRLGNVKITFEPKGDDLLSLRFKLEGVLVRGNRMPVTFETWIDPNGKVNITE
ncbi:MAG: type VI secretion system baseplate subunit TssE [Deltaproteobacteria bacterium]|nr:MAG: type VI secretion system baseplate subunit TssE [Deltaproteobacteria bacterium]